MYLCGKAIHVSRREGKARLSNKFWALHLVDTVAMWLKYNSTPPSRWTVGKPEVIRIRLFDSSTDYLRFNRCESDTVIDSK